MSNLIDVIESSFENEVLQSPVPVVVDLFREASQI